MTRPSVACAAILIALCTACPSKKRPQEAVTSTDTNNSTQPTEPAADSAQFPTNDLACNDTTASAITAWLQAYFDWTARTLDGVDSEGPLVAFGGEAQHVDVEPALVYVGPKTTQLNGRDIQLEQFADAFAAHESRRRREFKLLGREWSPPGIAISFSAKTPWSRVVKALENARVLEAGPLYLGFHLPWPRSLGVPKQALIDELEAHYRPVDTQQSPRAAAMLADCETLEKFFGSVGELLPHMRQQALTQRLGPAYVGCECKPDIEWLIALHLSPAEAPVTLVPIEVGEGKAVAHPPDATWRTTHKSLLNTGGPVVLTVKTTE